jgi:hypothetical protein
MKKGNNKAEKEKEQVYKKERGGVRPRRNRRM